MADARCANPEYQVDVDVMMLEYILYKAIQARIRLMHDFIHWFEDPSHESAFASGNLQEADRLLKIFDTLIHLFYRNHVNQTLKEETTFNIALLQFLFLLSQWLKKIAGDASSEHQMTDVSHRQLRAESLADRAYRRHWLRVRGENAFGLTSAAPERVAKDYETGCSLANTLLPRFLRLSEEIAHNAGEGSDKWMRLSLDFMLQAVLERFEFLENEIRHCNNEDGWKLIEVDLAECFAWGSTTKKHNEDDENILVSVLKASGLVYDGLVLERLQERSDVEERIRELFDPDQIPLADRTNLVPASSQTEISEWKKLRSMYWQEIQLTLLSLKEADADERMIPVQYLRQQKPLADFLKDLNDFTEYIWLLLHNPNMYGLPILIQIEQGKIDGMSDADFALFKDRVGI